MFTCTAYHHEDETNITYRLLVSSDCLTYVLHVIDNDANELVDRREYTGADRANRAQAAFDRYVEAA